MSRTSRGRHLVSVFYIVFPPPFVKEAVFSPRCFGTFVRNQMAVSAHLPFCRSTCLFLCQYHAVFITMALQYNLRSGIRYLQHCSFLLRIALAIQGLLCFHTNFRTVLFL
jgi:hypothetical protein